MECHYSRYSREEIQFLRDRAAAHGLTVTGGSDYHGINKRDLKLGMLSMEDTPWTPTEAELTALLNMV